MRKETRGGHTRDDYPKPSEEWGTQNIAISQGNDGEMEARITPLPEMPAELKVLFEEENDA
jgi:succinate dehydrogenase / fumarate reductase flavoprotein subunit